MKNLRTKEIHLRLTSDELTEIKRKAGDFYSVSQYIRCAIKEASDVSIKQRIQLMLNLSEFYQSYHNRLSWAGGNLNQTVKRANELAVAGLLQPKFIRETLMPVIIETQNVIAELKQELDRLTKNTTKP